MPEFKPDDISQVSHKLRTPLTVIMSTVHNLLDGAFGKINADQRKWLLKLTDHTQNLEATLNEMIEIIKKRPHNNDLIPDHKAASETSTPAPAFDMAELSQFNDAKILIVDDEPDILDTIQEGMHMKGFKTLTADNGEDALKLALSEKPDVILMDVLLKTQNGMDVCKKIKSQLPTFTPVLLVTGQNDLHNRIGSDNETPDDLLMKPFQMEELFSRVTSMLRIKKLHDKLTGAPPQDKAA